MKGSGVGVYDTQLLESKSNIWVFGKVLDPRSKKIQNWNRIVLLVRAIAFFCYVLSLCITQHSVCVYIDGRFSLIVTLLRSSTDAIHICHICLRFKTAYVSGKSLVMGCGKLVWNGNAVALHYLQSLNGFWYDVFVILPLPQIVMWFIVPELIRGEQMGLIVTLFLLLFSLQYLPKVYHSVCLMRRMQSVTGYVFGTVWWGFSLNLIAYFIASHVAGAWWYTLAVHRVSSCLHKHYILGDLTLSCTRNIIFYDVMSHNDKDIRSSCNKNEALIQSICLAEHGESSYGIYESALPLLTTRNWLVKVLYPIFWGLMNLSTFGNELEPTCEWLEVLFCIVMVVSGLLLFTLLIGNIQVFLHAVMASKRTMQLKMRDLEWWMRRRRIPSNLKHRVRNYESRHWVSKCVDEMETIHILPQGLRREIKHHLCFDLVHRVPLFMKMDDILLHNICDRTKPLLITKGEKILREGDPVHQMLFIARGHMECRQKLSKGLVSSCVLGPGNFCGDELLSWSLHHPFIERLPPSSATFTSLTDATHIFSLPAKDLKYITDHFYYQISSEQFKWSARYYSSTWRTWAAVTIQLAWKKSRA